MSLRRVLVCASLILLFANNASAARYQRTQDGKTLVWNNLRGVAQDVTWSGLSDLNGYATGEGTLTWYRLGGFVNSYTGKMVHGKFEGPVIRLQGSTQVKANFANGEKTSNWVEPESTAAPTVTAAATVASSPVAATPTPTPVVIQQTETPSIEPLPIASPLPTATSTPAPRPSLSPTPTPRPSPSPTPIATATATATARPSPTPTPIAIATIRPSPTPTPMEPPTRTPAVRSTPMGMPLLQPTQTPSPALTRTPTPLQFTTQNSPSPTAREQSPSTRSAQTSPSPGISPTGPPSTSGRRIDPALKRQMIADLKKQIDAVLSQVRDVTQNFREIDRLDEVRPLPSAVSGEVTVLANYTRQFQAKLGYEVTYYECLSEIETVDALGLADEVTRDLAAKDAPSARNKLSTFRKRYSEPTVENHKALWRYLVSIFALCDRLKDEAQTHLARAHSFETAGKLADAVHEYHEIQRIYPNPITAEKIRQLESRPQK